VANFFQTDFSEAMTQVPRRISLMLALAGCGIACAANAQQMASLPMAPSAMLALSQGAPAPPPTFTTKFTGGVTVEAATPGPLPLSLDDAIDRGLAHNLQIQLDTQSVRTVRGEILAVGNNLLPNMHASAYTDALEINLAALGFKPGSLVALGIPAGTVKQIVKVDTTDAQISMDQVLFSLPDYYLYRAAQKAADVASLNVLNTRGGVVEAVGTQYLATLADQAQIDNAQALLKVDEEILRQSTLALDAGVGVKLDMLRSRVTLQTQQQTLVKAENTFAKDKIALNRLIGLPADQEIALTDAVPYAEFAAMPLEQAKELAYTRRKDLLALETQMEVAERARKAVKYERVPTLAFTGFYGVLGETTGLYHGVFTAQGVLKIPIFEEGRFRGESEVTAAQEIGLRHQIQSLKVTIDSQIRASMLDVASSAELVKVARSNVDLATEALADSRDRFNAGVDDNLPVVRAQASLADAQTRLVSTQFQYNQAKLMLARNTGVVETQYKQYLGR
jgi:outer membrane protein TolC